MMWKVLWGTSIRIQEKNMKPAREKILEQEDETRDKSTTAYG